MLGCKFPIRCLYVAEAGSITVGTVRSGLALASASAWVRGLDVACRIVALGAGVAVVPEAAARRLIERLTASA